MAIEQFWNDVINTGVKIDGIEKWGFYYHTGKTYMVDMEVPGRISKETHETWKSMKLNMQDDE